MGTGGGGSGDTSRFTPARLVRNLRRGDYRAIATGRLEAGSADVTLSIAANGAVSGCRLIRSSGDSAIDRGLCPLLAQRLRFRPALDDRGRPIAYRTNYHASWKLGL
ncbi:MAG: energy transducer TonB, partial [Sphingomicrobium sp.]